jgi:nucleoside-diphosphate-sugar epimerase
MEVARNMGRTILITGGSGFIGGYITRRLIERGDAVINFDVREPRPEARWLLKSLSGSTQFVQGGVDDWGGVVRAIKTHQPDGIIHAAAIVNPVVLSQQPGAAYRVNLGGTINILEAARLFDVGRVVYFSSIGVLPRVQYEPIDGNHPVVLSTEGPGASFYGAAKLSGEAFCWAYHQSFGLDFITIRPSAVYGFGQQYPIYIKPMVENAVKGFPTRFDSGREFPRDYTHADDVAQLAVKALDVPKEGIKDRVFYGATGQPLVAAGEAADIVKRLIPEADIEIGSGLSAADLVEIRYRGVLDIQNAQEQLGYEPRFVRLRDGIADYIETYRRYLKEGGV